MRFNDIYGVLRSLKIEIQCNISLISLHKWSVPLISVILRMLYFWNWTRLNGTGKVWESSSIHLNGMLTCTGILIVKNLFYTWVSAFHCWQDSTEVKFTLAEDESWAVFSPGTQSNPKIVSNKVGKKNCRNI